MDNDTNISDTVTAKVFVLSLHRSGTTSVHHLLRTIGYKSLHWPIRDGERDIRADITGHETDLEYVWSSLSPLLERRESFSDVPFPVLYKQALRDFPNARFLLLNREPNSWLRSVRDHVGSRKFKPFERVQYWHYFPDRPKKLSEIDEGDLLSLPQRHRDAIENTLDAANQLLSIDLKEPDVGEQICTFLKSKKILSLPRISSQRSYSVKGIASKIFKIGK